MWWTRFNLPGWAVELIPLFCILICFALMAGIFGAVDWYNKRSTRRLFDE